MWHSTGTPAVAMFTSMSSPLLYARCRNGQKRFSQLGAVDVGTLLIRCHLSRLSEIPSNILRQVTRGVVLARTYTLSLGFLASANQRMIFCLTCLNSPQPSLLPLVDFLVNVFGWRLPQETCISCDKKVLPDDPRGPSLKDPAHKDRPTRQAIVRYA